MDFKEVESKFYELRGKRDLGAISQEEYQAELSKLMVQDEEGRWWTIDSESGQWLYHDGQRWVAGDPYRAKPGVPPPPRVPPPPVTPARPRGRINWLAIALGGLGLLLVLGLLGGGGFFLWRGFVSLPGEGRPPTVVINSPASGSQVQVGQEVAIQSTATDEQGVVRVELWVDGSHYRTEASPSPEGQPVLSIAQRWTPSEAGSHTLEVKAYNVDGMMSQAAPVTVDVVGVMAEATAGPTPTGVGATPPPEATPTTVPPTPPSTSPLSPGAVEVAYDDGVAERGRGSALTGHGRAVGFSPAGPVTVLRAKYYIHGFRGSPAPIEVHVWDADRQDLITPFAVTPTEKGWFEVDLSPYNVVVSGEFYLGYVQTSGESYPWIGLDTTAPDGRSFGVAPDPDDWGTVRDGDIMIRAVLSGEGAAATPPPTPPTATPTSPPPAGTETLPAPTATPTSLPQPAGLPDLTVTDITLVDGNKIRCSHKNIGGAEVPQGEVWIVIYVDGERVSHATVRTPIPAGRESWLQTGPRDLPASPEVRCVIDADNDVAEADEGNNELVKTL
ncbi:MAG: Ig-like domain-containing protein [Anaerolineae bacterium]